MHSPFCGCQVWRHGRWSQCRRWWRPTATATLHVETNWRWRTSLTASNEISSRDNVKRMSKTSER
ncbi:hypothetical protein DPMN_105050 [Dreissena polymorpha]|uniref:Uncharacterized protein n=1 Tax=Dreissena polymorpha TaxID=45954 RepID=A0A9D4HCM4_DREPO|nr:hypothetical protein DPMN_105050 [Dreissena polymorpha]